MYVRPFGIVGNYLGFELARFAPRIPLLLFSAQLLLCIGQKLRFDAETRVIYMRLFNYFVRLSDRRALSEINLLEYNRNKERVFKYETSSHQTPIILVIKST